MIDPQQSEKTNFIHTDPSDILEIVEDEPYRILSSRQKLLLVLIAIFVIIIISSIIFL
jgi:hypothetical protein